jgi:hypothetical protein
MQEGRYYLAIDATIWHAIATQTSVSIQTSLASKQALCRLLRVSRVSWQQVSEF